ncbi:MAG TPA: response regulator, partial [Thermoguttaceae bacterium]|nr:response regulator [Thermoguttaceae bacterium]
PDMNGYEFMERLREILNDPVPLILMTGFGHDPTHSLVKARQAGLRAALYKPFSLDRLLQAVEKIVALPKPVSPATA